MTLQAALHDAHSSQSGRVCGGGGGRVEIEKVTMGVIKSAKHRKSTMLAPKQTG